MVEEGRSGLDAPSREEGIELQHRKGKGGFLNTRDAQDGLSGLFPEDRVAMSRRAAILRFLWRLWCSEELAQRALWGAFKGSFLKEFGEKELGLAVPVLLGVPESGPHLLTADHRTALETENGRKVADEYFQRARGRRNATACQHHAEVVEQKSYLGCADRAGEWQARKDGA